MEAAGRWQIPRSSGIFFGVPIIRITMYWVYIGSPHFGKATILKQVRGQVVEGERDKMEASVLFSVESDSRKPFLNPKPGECYP